MKIENILEQGKDLPSYGSFQLAVKMLGFVRLVWPTALIAGLIVVLKIAVEVPNVYLLSPAITAVTHGFSTVQSTGFLAWVSGKDPVAVQLRTILLLMGVSQLFLSGMIYLRSVWDTKLSMRLVYHIRNRVYDHLQHVDFSFHDQMTSGQLINRALFDLQNVRAFINNSVLTSLDIVVSISAYLWLLYFRSPWLSLAALLPIPVWWVIIRKFNKKTQEKFQHQQEASDSLMVALTENITGIQVVRAFGLVQPEIKKFNALNGVYFKHLLDMVKIQSQLTPLLKISANMAHVILFVLSAWLIQKNKMSIGDLMILGLVMSTLLGKLQQINVIIEVFQKAMVSSRRLFQILDTPRSALVTDLSRGPAKENTRCMNHVEITFEQVKFGYDPSRPVLKGIDLVLPKNRTTLLSGPVGSGKSTLAGMISRFYDPQAGSIRINGEDLRNIPLSDLRHWVGYVFQETFLFSDTIRNNIRYGRMDVSEEMLDAAVRAAHAHEFIESLPNRYDTLLGEGGVQLSGGQKQRLALARALVYDPKILILDDATAALDPQTEKIIFQELAPILENRTVLLISNRPSALRIAHRWLYMNDGAVQFSGNSENQEHLKLRLKSASPIIEAVP